VNQPAYTRAAVDALTRAARAEHDFAGWLAAVLATVAARLGSSDALTVARPGSWEADLIDRLVKGTVGWDDHYLPDYAQADQAPDVTAPGPLETEQQASALPEVRAVYEAFDRVPRPGMMTAANHRMLCEAVTAAGVELGAYDHRILLSLAGFDPMTCAVVTTLIARAYAAGRTAGTTDEDAPACEDLGCVPGGPHFCEPYPVRKATQPCVTAGQLEVIGRALADATEWRSPALLCADCDASPGDLCADHRADLQLCQSYRDLSRQLGLELR